MTTLEQMSSPIGILRTASRFLIFFESLKICAQARTVKQRYGSYGAQAMTVGGYGRRQELWVFHTKCVGTKERTSTDRK